MYEKVILFHAKYIDLKTLITFMWL